MPCWLVKTEPTVYSIDDLKADKTTAWDSVRNYQARNYLKEMRKGDTVLIYHSNAEPAGIVGVGTVSREAFPDPTQFDRKSEYFDPKATVENPRWFCPEIRFSKKFARVIALADLRDDPALKDWVLLKRGNRLSVLPVSDKEQAALLRIAEGKR